MQPELEDKQDIYLYLITTSISSQETKSYQLLKLYMTIERRNDYQFSIKSDPFNDIKLFTFSFLKFSIKQVINIHKDDNSCYCKNINNNLTKS